MSALKVVYEGDQHDIRADVLLDSIGSVTNLISEVNTELGDGAKDLKIHISAPERGSFGIDLSLLADAAEMVMSAEGELRYTANLVVILTGLYELHQWLEGGDPDDIDRGRDTATIYKNDGDVLEVDANVLNLYLGNEDVRDELGGTYEATKKDERVEGFRIEDPETGEERFRADREEFEQLSRREQEEETRTLTNEDETVTLTRVPLDDPERKWEILWDGERVGVEIEDIGFHANVQTGDISFRRGDRLEVDLDRKQEYNAALDDWETTEYTITAVHGYIPAGEQTNLFSDNEDGE